jgi:hypothetical protein
MGREDTALRELVAKPGSIITCSAVELSVCITHAGSAEGDRPKDFSTKDTTNVVFVFERVKENEKP